MSGSAQIAEMWLFIDDRLTDWRRRRRRRRRKKATVRSAPDGSDNNKVSMTRLQKCKTTTSQPQLMMCLSVLSDDLSIDEASDLKKNLLLEEP